MDILEEYVVSLSQFVCVNFNFMHDNVRPYITIFARSFLLVTNIEVMNLCARLLTLIQ